MANSDMVQSVLKALDLFLCIAQSDHPLRLSDLSAVSGVKPPACRNLLRSLIARRFVVQNENGAYLAGPVMNDLSRRSRGKQVMQFAERAMRELAKRFPDYVLTFSELTPDAIRCRLRMSPDRPGELQRPEDFVFPPYSSVTSRCLQALSDYAGTYEEQYPFEEFGALIYPSKQVLLQERKKIFQNKYAVSDTDEQFSAAFFFADHFVFGISFRGKSHVKIETFLPIMDDLRKKMEQELK